MALFKVALTFRESSAYALSFNDHSSGFHPHNLMLRSTGTYFIMSYINGYCMPLSFKVEILLYILKCHTAL